MSFYEVIPKEVRRYKYRIKEGERIQVNVGIRGFRVIEEYFELDWDGTLTLLPGYAWDGMSGPARDTEDSMLGSAIHDALYQMMRRGLLPRSCRKQADAVFQEVNESEGMHWFRKWYTWLGVRLFGRHYNRRKYGIWREATAAAAALLVLLASGAVADTFVSSLPFSSSSNGEIVRLDANIDYSGAVASAFHVTHDNVQVYGHGFRLNNTGASLLDIHIVGANCSIDSLYATDFSLELDGSGGTMTWCEIDNTHSNRPLRTEGDNWTFEHSKFRASNGGVTDARPGSDGHSFEDCLFVATSGNAYQIDSSTGLSFIGCTFDATAAVVPAIATDQTGAETLELRNCIIAGPQSSRALDASSSGWALTHSNNLYWGKSTELIDFGATRYTSSDYLTWEPTAGYGDPAWTGRDGTIDGDYSVPDTSPAYELASPTYISTTVDITGAPREVGTGPEAGAWETQDGGGPVTGACCTSGAVCTVLEEASCTGIFWGDATTCAPNPCPDATYVDPYQIRSAHPRFWPPGHIARTRELYNGGSIDPSVPSGIQSLWNEVVDEADQRILEVVSTRQTSSNTGVIAAAYLVTGDAVYADSLQAVWDYYATTGTFYTKSDDIIMLALDLLWDTIPQVTVDALVPAVADWWGNATTGVDYGARDSGAMNLYGNEAYWSLPYAILIWGESTDEYQDWATLAMDEVYGRMMGVGTYADRGFYTWVNDFWPSLAGYPKGASYGAKYIAEALLSYAYMMEVSGLSSTPRTSIQTAIDGIAGHQLWHLRSDWTFLRGYPGDFLGWGGARDGDMQTRALHVVTPNTEADSLTQWWATKGGPYGPSSDARSWAKPAMFVAPDSLASTVADLSWMPRWRFVGTDGTIARTVGRENWYESVVSRWGSDPWDLDGGDGGFAHLEAGLIQRDNYANGRQLRLSIYYDGALVLSSGDYGDTNGQDADHYPYWYASSWQSAVPVVHLADAPNQVVYDSGSPTNGLWAAGGPSQSYYMDLPGGGSYDPGDDPVDWTEDGPHDPANLTAMGADTTLAGLDILYVAGEIHPAAQYFADARATAVTSITRRVLQVVPRLSAGRGLFLVRDEMARTGAVAEDGMWSNVPVIREPVPSNGTVATTWVANRLVDYSSIDHLAIANSDTLGCSATARLYPVAGVDYTRVIWGPGYEWWSYTDVDAPDVGLNYRAVGTTPTQLSQRWAGVEAGGGRVELHAADGANSADITWLIEAHSLDDEGIAAGAVQWVGASLPSFTSADVVGVVADSVVLVLPDDPSTGPWDFTFSGTGFDVIVAGLPDGNYSIGAAQATSSDSLLVFEDLDGGSLSLVAGAPTATGACCIADGSCSVNTEASCTGGGGTYQGDGTDCDPNPCPQPDPTGACCDQETCTVETETSCTGGGRTYQGDGTDCDPNPCPAYGACCYGADLCAFSPQGTCESILLGTWQGDATDCDPNPCITPTGACCAGDGSCSVATAAACSSGGGTYQGDATTCSPNPCPAPPTQGEGACCDPSTFACTVETPTDCAIAGGIYRGNDTPCAPDPCAAFGACCDGTTCYITTQERCLLEADVWEGEGVDCSPNPCSVVAETGACCVAASCTVTNPTGCEGLGGYYQGAGTVCSPNPCTIFGACCYGSTCVLSRVTPCLATSGAFGGEGSVCSPNPCSVTTATGACCTDFSCSITTFAGCSGGIYQGHDTVCSPDPCDDYGACCLRDDSCLFVRVSVCLAASGTYLGDGSDCDPDPCP